MAISGNATTQEGAPADLVRVFEWPAGALVGSATPDQNGDWIYNVLWDGEYGVTYIAQGCQPVTHGPYFVNGNFTPEALFLYGETGFLFDPSDKQALFQDASGTIPVENDGDPVGLMQDKSGNDIHA